MRVLLSDTVLQQLWLDKLNTNKSPIADKIAENEPITSLNSVSQQNATTHSSTDEVIQNLASKLEELSTQVQEIRKSVRQSRQTLTKIICRSTVIDEVQCCDDDANLKIRYAGTIKHLASRLKSVKNPVKYTISLYLG